MSVLTEKDKEDLLWVASNQGKVDFVTLPYVNSPKVTRHVCACVRACVCDAAMCQPAPTWPGDLECVSPSVIQVV